MDYDGNERRGLTARCRREDGSEHVVAFSEVGFPHASAGANYIAAYRRWLNLDPFPAEMQVAFRRKRQHKATADDLDLSKSVELVALAVKERAARCRLLGSDRGITLRASRLWDMVPGAIVTVKPRKQWRYEVGLRIGELSLGDDFNGVLPWGHIDNRPFLRCMHGYGLCLWRLGRFNEAERVFHRMLWLNPSDNQGVRFLIDEVKAKTAWEDRENK